MARADESGCHDSIRQTMVFIFGRLAWLDQRVAIAAPTKLPPLDKRSFFPQPETIRLLTLLSSMGARCPPGRPP
jgi:hypothetical protein